MWILWALIIGLIAGFVARLLVPSPDPMGVVGTLVLGLVGSMIGGFLGWLLFRNDADSGALQLSGIIGSIIGSVIALLVASRAVAQRQHPLVQSLRQVGSAPERSLTPGPSGRTPLRSTGARGRRS